jgi:hypothetical protein
LKAMTRKYAYCGGGGCGGGSGGGSCGGVDAKMVPAFEGKGTMAEGQTSTHKTRAMQQWHHHKDDGEKDNN